MAAELLQGVSVSGTGTARPLRSQAGKRLGSVFGPVPGCNGYGTLAMCLGSSVKRPRGCQQCAPFDIKFWVQAIHTEPPPATGPFASKKKNDQPGLVKVLCLSFDRKARLDHEKKRSSGTSYETMLGSSSWAHALFVCFPAAWMPLVVEALRQRTVTRLQGVMQQGAVARTASSSTVVPNNRELSFRLQRWHVDRRGQSPILHARAMLIGLL